MAAIELVDGQTLTLQGENGVVFDQDVPKAGTAQREVFEYLIATAKVQVLGVSEAKPEKAAATKKAAAVKDPEA